MRHIPPKTTLLERSETSLPPTTPHQRPPRRAWKTLALEMGCIAAGGVAGTLLRVLLSVTLGRALDHGVPLDIAIINISGSLALGLLAGWRDHQSRAHEMLWLALAVGFLGAYTTFSSFTLGIVTLAADGNTLLGLLYLGGSFALGLVAVELGLWLGARARQRRRGKTKEPGTSAK